MPKVRFTKAPFAYDENSEVVENIGGRDLGSTGANLTAVHFRSWLGWRGSVNVDARPRLRKRLRRRRRAPELQLAGLLIGSGSSAAELQRLPGRKDRAGVVVEHLRHLGEAKGM
jgi:hypothetical protein